MNDFQKQPLSETLIQSKEEFVAQLTELALRRPECKFSLGGTYSGVTSYELVECAAGYRRLHIDLPTVVSDELRKVWKTKPRWEGDTTPNFIGNRTLPSILTLLGVTDIKKQVKELKRKDDERSELNSRKYYNLEVIELTDKLSAAIAKSTGEGNDYDPNVMPMLTLLLNDAQAINKELAAKIIEVTK